MAASLPDRLGLGPPPSSGEVLMDVEDFEEVVEAPAAGEVLGLSKGPLVEANLRLTREHDNFAYALGLDYFEIPDGGFENVRIPPGTRVRAEYFYHAEPPISEGGGVFITHPQSTAGEAAPDDGPGTPTPAGSPGVQRSFATMLKMGV